MAELPVFALQDALERVDNDFELLAELIEIFFQEYERELCSLQQAMASDDRETFARSAHSLKGAAANVGAMQVSQAAAALEALDGAAAGPSGESSLRRLSSAVDVFRTQQQAQLRAASRKA